MLRSGSPPTGERGEGLSLHGLALAVLGEIEERAGVSLLLLVEMESGVVGTGVPLVAETNHLGCGPDGRTIAVGGSGGHRTIVVESGVEGHAGAHTSTLHTTLVGDLGREGLPTQLSHGTIGDATDPTLANSVGDAVGVDGGGRGFEIGVVAVEQLVPEALAGLVGGQTAHVATQLHEQEETVGMVLGEHVEQFDGGEQSPSVKL